MFCHWYPFGYAQGRLYQDVRLEQSGGAKPLVFRPKD